MTIIAYGAVNRDGTMVPALLADTDDGRLWIHETIYRFNKTICPLDGPVLCRYDSAEERNAMAGLDHAKHQLAMAEKAVADAKQWVREHACAAADGHKWPDRPPEDGHPMTCRLCGGSSAVWIHETP